MATGGVLGVLLGGAEAEALPQERFMPFRPPTRVCAAPPCPSGSPELVLPPLALPAPPHHELALPPNLPFPAGPCREPSGVAVEPWSCSVGTLGQAFFHLSKGFPF